MKDSLFKKDETIYDPLDSIIGQKCSSHTCESAAEQIFNKAEEEKYYKNLRDDLRK